MHQTNTHAIVEAGVMSAVAVIFALISAYFPILGIFVTLLWPVPFILLGVRHDFRWSVMATVVAAVMSAIFIQPLKAVSIIIDFVPIGLVLAHAFRARFGPFKTIMWGAVACLASNLGGIVLSLLVVGINPLNFQLEAMQTAVPQAMEIYRNFGMPEEQIAQLEAQFTAAMAFIPLVIPALLAVAAVFQTLLNFLFARVILRRFGVQTPAFPPFREWTLPRPFLYVLALGIISAYVGKSLSQDLLFRIGANLLWVSAVLFFGQGLALIYYLAEKYNLSRLMRNIILIMIITNGLLQLAAVLAGVYDLAADFRRLRTPRSS